MDYILFADGGSRGNPGPAAYGTAIFDGEGTLIAELAGFLGTATNNVAEYNGLLAGLRFIKQRTESATIEVRMDSKLVVEQMSGRWKIKHPDMRELAMLAHKTFPIKDVRFVWIPREENSHADRLANESLDLAARGSHAEVTRVF